MRIMHLGIHLSKLRAILGVPSKISCRMGLFSLCVYACVYVHVYVHAYVFMYVYVCVTLCVLHV